MVDEDKDVPDWGGALQSAISDEGEDDPAPMNVVANAGLSGVTAAAAAEDGELKYVTLLKAAAAMVKTGEITVDEYVEGVGKLLAINENALKIYQIPAVKKELPTKLTEHQYKIVMALEGELYKQKEGLERMLSWPQTQAIDDLDGGLEEAVGAMIRMQDIKAAADTEKASIDAKEKEDKARRVAQARAADEEALES